MYLRPPRKSSGKVLAAIILVWSLLFLLLGLTLSAGGIYLYFNSAISYPYLDVLREVFFDLRILVVLFGAVVTLCSLVSVLGICSKRRQLLQTYCYTVILLLLLQFGVALFTFINKQNLIDILHYECMALLSESDPVYPDFFNRVQTKLECCGCVAPADYSKLHSATLPDTCYSGENEVHNTGCLPALYKLAEDRSTLQIIAGSIAAALLLFIILVINCYIVKHKESFKGGSPNRVTPSPSPSTVNHKVSNLSTPTRFGKSNTSPPKGGDGVQRIMVREHSF